METVLAGRYYLIQPLGGGGFGQTFLATDRHLPGQPTCVVKQFKPRSDLGDSLQAAKRLFDLEAEILYRLGNHDRIPRLLAHFAQDGEFYLVQEFIEGESLQQEFTHCLPYPEAAAVALLHDILEVLAFVHQQNVIHRDIKPSNLIRRQSDRKTVLIDFGAVKQVSLQPHSLEQPSLTVAVGSPGYMPAEQLSFQPHFSSDLYAVGMVVLHALTGIHPTQFPKEEQTGEICCAVLGDRLHVCPEFATLLDTLVRYDYRHRYANATEALQALETLSSTIDAPVKPDSPTLILPDSTTPTTSTLYAPAKPASLPRPDEVETQLPLPPVPSFIQPLSEPARETYSVYSESVRGATGTVLSSREYRNRQALLNKVKNYWVKGVLEASLHEQVLIVLGLEAQPDAVASPWNMTLATDSHPSRSLPQGTKIISIFDQMGSGRTLLILGEPGSGKTTSLLQLTRDLIARAEHDTGHLIPVVLNLSSWSGEKTIAAWVIEELNTKYQVPKKLGQPWVEQQQLLLLLDGLDEVQAEHRNTCVVELNAFQREYGTEMVVCSRIRDYQALSNRLNVQSAISLRALTPEQIYHYLNHFTTDLTGLTALLQKDASLRELAQSPLMLNIMVLAYQDVAAGDLLESSIVEERRNQLFDAYINRMFKRRSRRWQNEAPYSKEQAIGWLSWLAQQMTRHSQTVFLIEQMQPTWLRTRTQRNAYWIWVVLTGVLLGIPVGISSGYLTNGLLEGGSSGLIKSIVNSLIFGLIFGTVCGRSKTEIETVETLQWSWKEARRNLSKGLARGMPWGLLGGILFGLMGELIPAIIPDLGKSRFLLGLSGGLTAGLTGGLVAGLISGLRGSVIETKTIPNQGIWRSALSAAISSVIGGCTGLLVVSLIYGLVLGEYYGVIYGVGYGLVGGLTAGFIFGGGQAYIKHFLLRLILHRQGYLPWNYARFLDYCCDRIFLQKVGGGYIFIHRLLMEHFAQMRGEG